MAKEITTLIRSDLSGEVIPEAGAVRIRIEFVGSRRKVLELDASESEVSDLIRKARPLTRHRSRGR